MKAAQALAQWLGGVKSGQGTLAEAEEKLAAHLASAPTSADPAEHRAWLATRRQLEDDVEAERGALAIAEAKAAEAKAAAAVEAADAEERRIRKLADEHAKLTVEVGNDAERFAAKLTRHTAMGAEIAAWNARRGSRAHMPDGEEKIRNRPSQTIAAVWDEVDVWADGAGRTPSVFRKLPNGELVPDVGGYSKTRERVLVEPERVIPGGIDGGRFAEMKLIGLKGLLFPTR